MTRNSAQLSVRSPSKKIFFFFLVLSDIRRFSPHSHHVSLPREKTVFYMRVFDRDGDMSFKRRERDGSALAPRPSSLLQSGPAVETWPLPRVLWPTGELNPLDLPQDFRLRTQLGVGSPNFSFFSLFSFFFLFLKPFNTI